MKIFISQPMSNRTNEQILNERNCIVYKIDKQLNTPYEIIDSFFDEVYNNENPLFYLGKSIELMSQADLVYFTRGWEQSRGCNIEHECAKRYGLVRYYE